METKHMEKIANITAGVIFFLMLVRTWEKYFGAVWIAFALFLCVDMIYCHKYHRKIFPALHDSKIIIGSIILFYASLFLSSLFNGADGSMGFSFSLMKFTVPMWMLLYIIGKYKAMEGSMVGIAAGGLISSGYCIYQYFFIYPTEKEFGGRVFGLFQNPNLEGAVLEVLIPMLIYCIVTLHNKYLKGISFLSLIISYGALYLTGSRGAMLGLLIGTLLSVTLLLFLDYKIMDSKFKKKVVLYAGILCLINGGIFSMTFTARPVYQGQSNQAIQMEQQTERNRPTGNKRINSSDMERLKMIKASFYMWQDHKISGIGMGSWEKSYYTKYHLPDANLNTHYGFPHNMIMFFLACGGIIGLIGYVIFTFGIGIGIVTERSSRVFVVTAAMLAMHIAFFVHGLVDQTIICRFCSYLYYGFMGLFITSGFEQGAKKEED